MAKVSAAVAAPTRRSVPSNRRRPRQARPAGRVAAAGFAEAQEGDVGDFAAEDALELKAPAAVERRRREARRAARRRVEDMMMMIMMMIVIILT